LQLLVIGNMLVVHAEEGRNDQEKRRSSALEEELHADLEGRLDEIGGSPCSRDDEHFDAFPVASIGDTDGPARMQPYSDGLRVRVD